MSKNGVTGRVIFCSVGVFFNLNFFQLGLVIRKKLWRVVAFVLWSLILFICEKNKKKKRKSSELVRELHAHEFVGKKHLFFFTVRVKFFFFYQCVFIFNGFVCVRETKFCD